MNWIFTEYLRRTWFLFTKVKRFLNYDDPLANELIELVPTIKQWYRYDIEVSKASDSYGTHWQALKILNFQHRSTFLNIHLMILRSVKEPLREHCVKVVDCYAFSPFRSCPCREFWLCYYFFFNHLLITFIVTRYTSEDISLITVHSTVNSITPLVTVELLTNSGAYKCQSTVGKLICMTV